MHIRCPNCRKAIECVQRTPPCGSSMHLVIAKGILAQAPPLTVATVRQPRIRRPSLNLHQLELRMSKPQRCLWCLGPATIRSHRPTTPPPPPRALNHSR
jgi:hypothetical protein